LASSTARLFHDIADVITTPKPTNSAAS